MSQRRKIQKISRDIRNFYNHRINCFVRCRVMVHVVSSMRNLIARKIKFHSNVVIKLNFVMS